MTQEKHVVLYVGFKFLFSLIFFRLILISALNLQMKMAKSLQVYSNPEAQIGFHPDAGASYYLSRLPGYLGKLNNILLISRILCGAMLVSI